jgi:hypothetical protein
MSSRVGFAAIAFIMMIFCIVCFWESSTVAIRGWKQVKQQFEPNSKFECKLNLF